MEHVHMHISRCRVAFVIVHFWSLTCFGTMSLYIRLYICVYIYICLYFLYGYMDPANQPTNHPWSMCLPQACFFPVQNTPLFFGEHVFCYLIWASRGKKSQCCPSAQMTMPARRTSKLCAKRSAASLPIFWLRLISLAILEIKKLGQNVNLSVHGTGGVNPPSTYEPILASTGYPPHPEYYYYHRWGS